VKGRLGRSAKRCVGVLLSDQPFERQECGGRRNEVDLSLLSGSEKERRSWVCGIGQDRVATVDDAMKVV
jgi:hypothetical protein